MNKNISILINSCDNYQDVVHLNLCAFEEYWSNCFYPIYINTETTNYDSNIFNIISLNSGFANWGKRFIDSLNTIKTDFVLVIYDDYILEKQVNENELNKIIDKMIVNNNISCFYLKHTEFSVEFDSEHDLYFVKNSNNFLINSGPALWRRKDLLTLLDEKDDPWAWEFFAKYRKSAKKLKLCSVPDSSKNIYEYNHTKGGAVYRGKWVEEVVVPKIEKYNLYINIEERGKINLSDSEPRSIFWKVNFFTTGFKMVGFKSFNLFIYLIQQKYIKSIRRILIKK